MTVYSAVVQFIKHAAYCENDIYLVVINIIRGVKLFDKSSNVLDFLKPCVLVWATFSNPATASATHSHHITRVSSLYPEYTHLQNTFYKKIICTFKQMHEHIYEIKNKTKQLHTCFGKTSEYFICNKHCYGLRKSLCLTWSDSFPPSGQIHFLEPHRYPFPPEVWGNTTYPVP